jgi:hypothetical protein
MALNRPNTPSAETAAALRQSFELREAGSLETLSRSGRARLHQKLAATPVARHSFTFMVPLVSGLAGLAILAAAITFIPRHTDTTAPVQNAFVGAGSPRPSGNLPTVEPTRMGGETPPLQPPPAVAALNPAPRTSSPKCGRGLRHPDSAHDCERPTTPAAAISMPPVLQAASIAGAGGGQEKSQVEPEVKMAKSSAGITLSWAAAGGEKFIVSKTCYADHDFRESPDAARTLLVGSGEWTDTAPNASGCDQTRYEVRRVA